MEPILCGIETEYGFTVEGVGPERLVEESAALVRSFPGERFTMWDDRNESPRNDLRGFRLDKLQFDPIDAQFDAAKETRDVDRADQILANGARFYNDHGHPEYATPECNDVFQCALQDRVGEHVVLQAAAAYAEKAGRETRVYKNNTDFHGASYGTHESYCVPRSIGWERLYQAVLPMLIVRSSLCGAGKVGAESGPSCRFQASQRADFFVESINAETLFRRPIFNTRDEPHADPAKWIRLHVISGDANLSMQGTARKMALVKLAIQLAIAGRAPQWEFKNPVQAAQQVSRDPDGQSKLQLADGGQATLGDVFASYFSAANDLGWIDLANHIGPERQSDPYLAPFLELFVIGECSDLLRVRTEDPDLFARNVEWAAKRRMLEMFAEDSGDWNPASLTSLDLEFSAVERERSLYWAMADQGEIEDVDLPHDFVNRNLGHNTSGTRSEIRSYAVRRFRDRLASTTWFSLTFKVQDGVETVFLPPDWRGSLAESDFSDVESFIKWIRSLK